jgi:hypothetical protein
MVAKSAVQYALSAGQQGVSKSTIMKTLVKEHDCVTADVYQILKVTHPGTSYQVCRNTLASAGLHYKRDQGVNGSTAKNTFDQDLSMDDDRIAALLAKLA